MTAPHEPITGNEEGEVLFNKVLSSFAAARNHTTQQIDLIKYVEAARTMLPVYDSIFGTNMISKILKEDLTNSTEDIKKSFLSNPISRETVDSLLKDELKVLGINKLKEKTGTSGLLWSKRALDMIITFLENTILSPEYKDKPTSDAAHAAYSKTLKPYHGIIVSRLVKLAFKLCPSKDQIIKSLGFTNDSVVPDRVTVIVTMIRPFVDEIDKFLTDNEVNFTHKV